MQSTAHSRGVERLLGQWAAAGGIEAEERAKTWQPQPGPQSAFYYSDAYETLYGGAAGGGKTSCGVALALPWLHHPQLRVLMLRRTTPQLEDMLDKARGIYRDGVEGEYAGACPTAEFRGDKNLWTFPSGARVRFNHCQYAEDAFNYQGHEYQIIVFDELTHFEESQYREIATRIRAGVAGLPRRLCATTNPGGSGNDWVFKRWRWWLDPKAEIPGRAPRLAEDGRRLPPAEPGEILWVVRRPGSTDEEVLEDHKSGACLTCGESEACSGEPHARVAATSRTFIPAKASDNPALMRTDPGYTARLLDNDPVRAAQLIDGDWLVKSGAGLYFKREWVTFVDADAVPANARRCRAWDRAATEPSEKNRDPDWTRGVRLAYADGRWYIEHVASLRAGPGPVKNLIMNTAESDGKGVRIRIPQDPGQAGKQQAVDDVAALTGFTVTKKPVTGNKVTRFGPVSSQAHPQSTGGEKGRFCIVRGPWNEELIRELEEFPDGAHDDIADALADAHDDLAPLARSPGGVSAPSPTRRDPFGGTVLG